MRRRNRGRKRSRSSRGHDVCDQPPVQRFRQGAVSSSRAAHILNLTRRDFLELLAREGLPLYDPSDQELAGRIADGTTARTCEATTVICNYTPLIYLASLDTISEYP